jgi:hypothetical protein
MADWKASKPGPRHFIELGDRRGLATQINASAALSAPIMATAFIDHSNEMWNFCCERAALLSQLNEKGEAMRKTLMALAAIATLAVSAVTTSAPAQAQRGLGAGIAAGVIGGAIIGGALAGPRYYGPGYGYYGGPAYVADDYYGGCYWQRQRFWDGYGWRARRVRVCG